MAALLLKCSTLRASLSRVRSTQLISSFSSYKPPSAGDEQDDAKRRVVTEPLEHADGRCVEANDAGVLHELAATFSVREDFLSEAEERAVLDEIEPYMKRLRYEFDHWDNAIHGYRETERTTWSPASSAVLDRIRSLAFFKAGPTTAAAAAAAKEGAKEPPNLLAHVHILDLHKDGYIKPHVDAVRFCGDTIAGICLLSDCVMRLTSEKEPAKFANILLKRRSMYIMKNESRYNYAHEILRNSDSYFRGRRIEKNRRISIICRNKPEQPAD